MDHEPFYHTRTLPLSIIISATKAIEAKNIAHVTPSIVQKTQQLNIKSLGLRLVKLFCVVGSFDQNNSNFNMTHL